MKYEFRTADGRVCCSTTRPEDLCDACKHALAEPSQAALQQRDDWEYDPYGTPPDPYLLALEARKTHGAKAKRAVPSVPVLTNGVPDPYATALAERSRA